MRFPPEAERLISAFRNLPEHDDAAYSGSKSLSSSIEACMDRYHIGRSTPGETILAAWDAIVGPRFAKLCRPVRIDRSGNLVVSADNASARRELMFMEDRILTAVASMPECGHVRRVVLIAG
jgi:hypothetical protein